MKINVHRNRIKQSMHTCGQKKKVTKKYSSNI